MITWDESKRQSKIAKHGIDFIDADSIFHFPMVTREDDREYGDGEQRLQTLAILQATPALILSQSERRKDMSKNLPQNDRPVRQTGRGSIK